MLSESPKWICDRNTIAHVLVVTVALSLLVGRQVCHAQEIDVPTTPVIVSITRTWYSIPPSLGELQQLQNVSLYVRITGSEPSKLEAFATDLIEEKNRSPPISSSSINVVVKQISSNVTIVQLTSNLPASTQSGSYSGKIVVSLPNSQPNEVPLTIVISDPKEWGLLAVLIGVLLSFLSWFISEMNNRRNDLRKALGDTDKKFGDIESALMAARNANKTDIFFLNARDMYQDAASAWEGANKKNKGAETYNDIGGMLDLSKQRLNAANIPPDPSVVRPALIDFKIISRSYPSERLGKATVREFIKNVFFLQYAGLSIAFFIITFSAWQGFAANLVALGANRILDYVAAILYGFGSQSALTQSVDLAKSWYSSRSASTQ